MFVTPRMELSDMDALFETLPRHTVNQIFAAQDPQGLWFGLCMFTCNRYKRRMQQLPFSSIFEWESCDLDLATAHWFVSTVGAVIVWEFF